MKQAAKQLEKLLIEGFLQGYKGATRLGYRSSIFQFLDYKFGYARKGKDSTQEERAEYEKMAAKYLRCKIDLLTDLRGFKDHQFERKRPPHSISQNVACVRIWLEHYDHSLTSKELRELKKHLPRQRNGVTREDEVTPEMIRLILSHSRDTKIRAVVLLLLSSGIRIGELVKLTPNDVDLEKNTIYISDLISKTGESRITFFTDEAREALLHYLKFREKMVARAQDLTTNHIKKEYHKRSEIFPYTSDNIRERFNTCLKNAALKKVDLRTGRNTIHPHSFRKCFISWLKLAGCPDDVVEAMAGHTGYLSVSYRRYGEGALREQYQKYSSVLTIGDYGFEKRKQLEERVGGQADRLLALEREKEKLQAKLIEMEQKMTAINTLDNLRGKLTMEDHIAIAKLVAEEMKKEEIISTG
ncbi:MAG TPA: site-specific integrase [Methanoregulaceae archaeon]|nr:site-specific integrase [Methanoregulaceae archaeon]HPD75547.1 site-specific integrase [Methanoregulaceae archaeon]